MSGGQSDAAAEGRLVNDVWEAAFDLRDCITRFAHAVKVARMGHRGWGVPRSWILTEVSAVPTCGFTQRAAQPAACSLRLTFMPTLRNLPASVAARRAGLSESRECTLKPKVALPTLATRSVRF